MNVLTSERMRGPLVALAVYFEPWAMVAISIIFQFINLVISENLMSTDLSQADLIAENTKQLTGFQDQMNVMTNNIDQVATISEFSQDLIDVKANIARLNNLNDSVNGMAIANTGNISTTSA